MALFLSHFHASQTSLFTLRFDKSSIARTHGSYWEQQQQHGAHHTDGARKLTNGTASSLMMKQLGRVHHPPTHKRHEQTHKYTNGVTGKVCVPRKPRQAWKQQDTKSDLHQLPNRLTTRL